MGLVSEVVACAGPVLRLFNPMHLYVTEVLHCFNIVHGRSRLQLIVIHRDVSGRSPNNNFSQVARLLGSKY